MFYQTSQKLVILLCIVIAVAMFGVLLTKSLPTWHAFGWHFFTGSAWDPANAKFGALPAILGTLISSILAVLFATPIAIMIAFTIQEYLPQRLKRMMRISMDLAAGIPSIIYGIWGMFVLIPLMANYVQPFLQNTLGTLPWIGSIFAGPPIGLGLLTASFILTLMILPIMIALLTDLMSQIPPTTREAAYGLGCNQNELFPLYMKQIKRPLWGTIILALGRALGETMAVTFVLGNSHQIITSLIMPATTMSATIANEFSEAIGPLYPQSLFALGLILLTISFCVIILARILLTKEDKT